MLIISKFKDYYDTAIGYGGVDKTCVYNRNSLVEGNKHNQEIVFETFEEKKIYWSNGPYIFDCRYKHGGFPYKDIPFLITPFVIGFCGKIYIGYYLKWENKTKIVYNSNDFFQLCDPKDKRLFRESDKNRIINYFKKLQFKNHKELFFKYHAPIFILDYKVCLNKDEYNYLPNEDKNQFNKNKIFIINPKLKDYEFYKIYNSFQAFQEIQMYLQGVLGNKEKEMINISEKNKLIQYGYDKWSFRNPDPPKRKQK